MSIIPNNIFKLRDNKDYITATTLAKVFAIEPRQLNQILTNMKWIEKEHYVWWVATDLGKKNGAIEYKNKESRVRYVYWHKDIVNNEELIATIKNTVRTYIENNLYEKFVKEYYITQGYTVWHYAEDTTRLEKNRSITLVAKKNRQIILIHCRDNQLDISVDELKNFQEQRDGFKTDNPVFADYDLTLHYTMSGFFLTEDAYEYIEDYNGQITYEIIKGESENTWLDSLLLSDEKS